MLILPTSLVCTKSISYRGTDPVVRPDIPTPPYDALLPRTSSQCWASNVPQEREVSMRVCRYEGASSTEVKASPCVSQGLRSTRSPDPISVCGAIRPLTLSPERPPVQPHWGQHLWTWWGEERIKSWREVGCKEIGSPFSQHVLWSAMQTGIRKRRLGPQLPNPAKPSQAQKGKEPVDTYHN